MPGSRRSAFFTSFWRVCRVLGGIFGIMMMLDALVGHSAPGVQWQEFVPGLLLLMAMVIFSRW